MLNILKELLAILKNADLSYTLLAVIVYFFSVFVCAYRWKTVLSSLGYRVKTSSLVPIIFGGIFFNNITPASKIGGEPVRIYWLKESKDVPLSSGTISILYERAIEAIPVLVLALYASHVLKHFLPGIGYLKDLLFLLVIVLAFVYFLRRGHTVFKSLIETQLFSDGFTFSVTFFTSSLVWILDLLRLRLISLALGTPLPIRTLAVVSILYLVLGFIPVTPGGIGIVEGGLTSVLALTGIGVPLAVGIVIVERSISYILSTAVGGILIISIGGQKTWRHIKSP